MSGRIQSAKPPLATLRGTIKGGGILGPGGSVIWLEAQGGSPSRVKPAADKFIVYHNVFSLSRPNEFDLGMYKQGLSRSKVFDTDSVNVALTIDADRSLPAFVPDKTGKPRQPQLGY